MRSLPLLLSSVALIAAIYLLSSRSSGSPKPTDPPIGSMLAFAGEWPPRKGDDGVRYSEEELGWVLCDGRELKGEQYSTLRDVLGDDRLPNYGGRVLVIAGAGDGLTPRKAGDRGGEEKHTMTEAEMAAHSHEILDRVILHRRYQAAEA